VRVQVRYPQGGLEEKIQERQFCQFVYLGLLATLVIPVSLFESHREKTPLSLFVPQKPSRNDLVGFSKWFFLC